MMKTSGKIWPKRKVFLTGRMGVYKNHYQEECSAYSVGTDVLLVGHGPLVLKPTPHI